jgi:hypothetical protein
MIYGEMKMKKAILAIMVMIIATGCAPISKDSKQDLAQPVNCATAPADLRALESEKTHVGEQIAAGVTAIVPVSLVVNIVKGTEKDHFTVATGDYNDMLDKKIAEIKVTCGL